MPPLENRPGTGSDVHRPVLADLVPRPLPETTQAVIAVIQSPETIMFDLFPPDEPGMDWSAIHQSLEDEGFFRHFERRFFRRGHAVTKEAVYNLGAYLDHGSRSIPYYEKPESYKAEQYIERYPRLKIHDTRTLSFALHLAGGHPDSTARRWQLVTPGQRTPQRLVDFVSHLAPSIVKGRENSIMVPMDDDWEHSSMASLLVDIVQRHGLLLPEGIATFRELLTDAGYIPLNGHSSDYDMYVKQPNRFYRA